jgi:hypothetical protein
MLNITRWLIKPPEHTWGLPNVNDATAASSWSNPLFEENRKLQGFTDCESAWGEQRMFNQFAVEAAAPNPQLQQQMISALQEVEASEPDLSRHTETQMSQFTCGKTSFATGAHAASQRCSTSALHRFSFGFLRRGRGARVSSGPHWLRLAGPTRLKFGPAAVRAPRLLRAVFL